MSLCGRCGAAVDGANCGTCGRPTQIKGQRNETIVAEHGEQRPVDPFAGLSAKTPRAATALSSITTQEWKLSGVFAIFAFAGALVGAFLMALPFVGDLSRLGGYLGEDGAEFRSPITFVIQMLGVGFLNPLGGNVSVETFMEDTTVSFSISLVSAIVPVSAMAAVLLLGRRQVGALGMPVGFKRITVASVAGLTTAAIVMLLTVVLPVRVFADTYDGFVSIASLRAVSFRGFIFCTLIVGLATFLALGARGERLLPLIWRQALRSMTEHVGFLALVTSVPALIVLAVNVEDERVRILLGIPTLVSLVGSYGSALATLSGASASGNFGSILGDTESRMSFSLFSSVVPGWVKFLTLAFAALAVVVAGIRWRIRRGPITSTLFDWIVLPSVYGACGLLITILSAISIEVSTTGFGAEGAGTLGLAGYTSLLFASLGLLVGDWSGGRRYLMCRVWSVCAGSGVVG